MAGMVSPKQLTIEEEEERMDENIRVYGSTTDRSPPFLNNYSTSQSEDKVKVWIQDPHHRLQPPIDDAGDNDSLMRGADGSENEYDPSQPCWKHPKIRENWKMVLAASGLLVLGVCLFMIGVGLTVNTSFAQGVVFFIAGVICFIPGIYHVVYIYLAVKGRRGYYFYHLPLFN